MKSIAIISILLAWAGPAAAADLTIMVEDASEPFSRADGSGYANDIVRAAFAASHIDVRLDVVPYARCKLSVLQGKTPACFAMSWSPEFAGKIAFSDQPLFHVYADIFRNGGTGGKLAGAADFRKGAVLGVVNEYEYSASINQLANRGVVFYRGIDELAILNMLSRRRIDAAVIMTSDFVDGHKRLLAAGVSDTVAFGYRGGTLNSYIGFSLLNPKGQEARREFNEGYKIILRNGTAAKIKNNWMHR